MTRLVRYRRGEYRDGEFDVDRWGEWDCPPVPEGVRELLVTHCHPHDAPSCDEPVTWHHRGHGPWGAVDALHRRDRHNDAGALARLIRWTETTYSHEEADGWELYAGSPASPATEESER
ncbi:MULTISPECIES: hypothetical protein [Pseudonocardia]|uniref:Uncharacterized protein n=2 Tax=Pseudonocardia TaxID=1847 RepID=A0A1Y2MM10_PSEAH|nr:MULTISPECIES: hypothetical protein [Pseudonocardia]OSY36101.1 hypothetical protein BG845_05616 [Pseudonocardia autotrophica]TDN77583.1 hypothetical protein C8E95_6832 [Pseudonocardia autotrophica]BBG01613.1 hypothetical protein Pdca_28220 [Pseudonocardia autotrophica]GEC25358.1 hypothetical protein PSA01_23870 [Pseudonocardia saturnea]